MNLRTFGILLLCFSPIFPASADMVGYSGRATVSITNNTYRVTHTHNWSSRKIEKLYFDFSQQDKFFTAANDFSKITVISQTSGKTVFETPCPALSYLWLSPDSHYLVGLSQIKLDNPYQLAVWDIERKKLIWKERISSRVAVLTGDEFSAFSLRFPKVKKNFPDFIHPTGNQVIIDGHIPANEEWLGKGAWEYLYEHWKPHPYSTNFSESVSNWVEWHYKDPQLQLEEANDEIVLSLLDPKQQRFFIHIPVTKVTQIPER